MAIVKMSDFSLFAFDSDRENLLHELQKFEYVHFLDLEKEEDLKVEGLKNVKVPDSIVEIEEEISKVRYVIDILSKYHTKETGIKAMQIGLDNFSFKELEERAAKINYHPIYDEVRELWTNKENISQEIVKLKTNINDLSPWINLNSPIRNFELFQRSEVFLGTIPKKLESKINNDLLETKYTYYEVISEDKDNLHVMAIADNSEADSVREILRGNSFSNIRLTGTDTPEEEIKAIETKIKKLEDEIQNYESSIKDLSVNLPNIEMVFDYLMNKKLRVSSSENFLMTEQVNVIKGFIPTEMVNDFTETIKKALNNVYYLEIKDADKDDQRVPILLKNSKFTETFESLTGMYALPKYNEIDPTPFLAPFYLIFFGMMAADFGYGLIMLIGTFVVLKKFNLSENTRKFIRFFYYLSFSVAIWGLIFGSIFGGIIPIKGLLNPATDYMTLLIMSIGFGLIHIFFALGLKAFISIRDGNILDAVYDVGFWVLALVGGIVYLLASVISIPSTLKTIALGIMVLGMVGIVATGGRESKGIAGRLVGGLYSLYGISSYVGDFVSYSRLMALGLAGGFIAGAINMLAGMAAKSGVIGFIGAIAIFIFGQAFNLGLSILGAYVHTIRLTFVEFFGKFYEGGGKQFKLFRSKPKYINLK